MVYIHGIKSQKRWKRILERITTAIEKSIKKNVKSDGFHLSCLNRYVTNLKEAYKSKNLTDIDIILSLTGIIFELLGGLPDYSHRKIINRKSDYFLDDLRSLQYLQTPYQKMRTILEAARYKPYSDYHNHDDLFEVYASKYNGNPEGFIQWYKNKYPEVYSGLF